MLEPKQVFAGRFEITHPPKKGGMGTVYRAKDLKKGQIVALKLLFRPPRDFAADGTDRHRLSPTDLKRCERERQMHERLGGQGIPRLVDYEFDGGQPFLVTEYVEGKNLRDFLESHRPTLTATASIVVQLLRVLERVHAALVVHRDVKPQNVILAANGEVFLVDFGIALPGDPDATRLTEGNTPGSFGYKAPEIILGERSPTGAADIYGVGCTVFRLVTGVRVFSGASDHIVEQHHCTTPAPRLDTLIPGLPSALVDVVAQMLTKDPAARPSPAEAVQALAPLLPKPGDPAPDPMLIPDPTLPFRVGTGAPAPNPAQATVKARGRRPMVRRRTAGAPDRAAFRALLHEAERELEQGGRGSRMDSLEAALQTVRGPWGSGDPDVVRARLLCADGLRHSGDWPGAGARYRLLARELDGAEPGTQAHAWLLEARLGAAEALIPEDDGTNRAFPAWEATVRELSALTPPQPLRLVSRAQESGEEFREWGHGEAVEDLLGRLSAL